MKSSDALPAFGNGHVFFCCRDSIFPGLLSEHINYTRRKRLKHIIEVISVYIYPK
jgi:hypothetical protein